MSFVLYPVMQTADLRAQGVHPRQIAAAVDRGELFRAAPGIVVTETAWRDQDLQPALASHLTPGVIGLLSAAVRHELCDANPSSVHVIASAEVRRPPAGLPCQLFRTRSAEALTVGVEVLDFHGIEWRCTNPARTVVDLYRITPDAWRQHAVAGLATYMQRDLPVRDLHRCAAAFGCWELLRPEVEAIVESHNRGMKP